MSVQIRHAYNVTTPLTSLPAPLIGEGGFYTPQRGRGEAGGFGFPHPRAAPGSGMSLGMGSGSSSVYVTPRSTPRHVEGDDDGERERDMLGYPQQV